MNAQLADAARRSLSEDVKRMTPEQRLAAFLAHCQIIARESAELAALAIVAAAPSLASGRA